MTTLAIRKKLVAYMQNAEDKKIKAVYTLLETDIETIDELESIEQYNKALELADEEIEKGYYITHTELLKLRQARKQIV